jgi:hypothetical protein
MQHQSGDAKGESGGGEERDPDLISTLYLFEQVELSPRNHVQRLVHRFTLLR